MDPTKLELTEAAAFWVMDLLPSEHLPDMATHALAAGHDSPTLRQLAGETERIRSTVGPLWETSLRELGIAFPSRASAQLVVARHYARRIVERTMTPYEGARRIWMDAANDAFPHEAKNDVWDQLSVFVGLASQWEDDTRRRRESEREIVERAVELLAQDAA
jgi:hypothetical protein